MNPQFSSTWFAQSDITSTSSSSAASLAEMSYLDNGFLPQDTMYVPSPTQYPLQFSPSHSPFPQQDIYAEPALAGYPLSQSPNFHTVALEGTAQHTLVAPLPEGLNHSPLFNHRASMPAFGSARHTLPVHALSLDIQPCISITEPTPIRQRQIPELALADQLIAQHEPGSTYAQNLYQDPFALQPNTDPNTWLSWTPNRGSSPISDVFGDISLSSPSPEPLFDLMDRDVFESFQHTLNSLVEPVYNDPGFLPVATQEAQRARTRRLSEPPKPTGHWSPPSTPPVETPRRHNSARRPRSSSNISGVSAMFPCTHPGCNKVFTRLYNLTSHARTHTPDRPFPCSKCGRCFARQHDRNRHEKLHWGVKPYACHVCSKAFVRMDALNRHLRVENGCSQASGSEH
ncbi:hypothetical protein CLU79DRAFT_729691 [Phycomyces nitens]|nr:hypothetical protein CLU79DRAFT_729691 [Phycomyces nitens]